MQKMQWMMLLCMNVMNVICMLTILWQRYLKRILGKRTASQFEQILSEYCSNGADVHWRRIWVACFKLSEEGISLATGLGILFGIRIPTFDDFCWGEDCCSSWFILRRSRHLRRNCWSSFRVHNSKENLCFCFKIFWSKNSFKTF